MNIERWFDKALTNIDKKIAPRTSFELKEVFEGHEWQRLSRGERIFMRKIIHSAKGRKL